jgi:SAM-dependent methyltransferase
MSEKSNDTSTEDSVSSYYDKVGWKSDGEKSLEDIRFRTFPEGHEQYSKIVADRTLATLSGRSGTLIFVGSGDMPSTHVQLASQYERVICLDISQLALDIAKSKLGDAGEFLLQSIVDSDLPDGTADSIFSAHVVYHIDRDQQEKAIRQMLRLTKPGGRIVVIYANPRSVFTLPGELIRRLKGNKPQDTPQLYYHAHPLGWWNRFKDSASISLVPWEAIGSRMATSVLKTPALARGFFRAAESFERIAPGIAARMWHYPVIVLDKR